jgi:hypothetical protein
VLRTDRAVDAVAFLKRALAWYQEQGVTVEAVMTDNGPAYLSRLACATCAPARTPRAPTARRNASSRRCCGSGPTPSPTPPAHTALVPSRAGSGGTTDADLTPRSGDSHRSAVSHRFVVTTPSRC